MDEIERVACVARQLGMKASEVLEVVQVDGGELAGGGQLVRTHDGQWTLIRDDGTCTLTAAPEVTLVRDSGVAELATGGIVKDPVYLVGETGPESIEAPKPAPKRRGRA
jgi:hypothetical protein